MRSMRKSLGLGIVALLAGCYMSSPAQEDAAGEPSCTGNPATAAVVDRVASVSAPTEGTIRVTLAGGGTWLLDLADHSALVWADIIESIRSRGDFVYLEYDRETRVVVDLGLPMEYEVLTIRDAADGVDVTFEISAAIHHLLRTQPCYDFFLGTLRDALARGTKVLVTDSVTYDHMLDVRPMP